MDGAVEELSSTLVVGALTVILGIFVWVKFVKTGPVYRHQASLRGTTVLITGGNSGNGKQTAVELAKIGARVIIACRNENRASEAVLDIRNQSGNEAVHYMIVNLSDLDSVRRFAEEFIETEPRLNILINNAATMTNGRTKDGFDVMFATNHLGPFLLTNLLMPLLRKTATFSPVRVINMSSDGYRFGKVDLDNLNPVLGDGATFGQIMVQYFNTKLMTVYFTSELANKLRENPDWRDISTFAVHPGIVLSRLSYDFSVNSGGWYMVVRRFLWPIVCRSPFYGCQTVLYCCLEEGLEERSGKYFDSLKMVRLLPHACDDKMGKKLWEVSEQLCGLEQEQ